MTAHEDFDRRLATWLEADAPRSAPPGLHEAVVERASRAHQRPAWLAALRGPAIPRSAGVDVSGVRLASVMLLVALLLVALVVALLAGALRPAPRPLGGNGAIAFAAQLGTGSPDDEAHPMSADGKTVRSIGTGHATCPTFSRDGRVLGYVTGSVHTDSAELQVAAPDGSSPRPVPGVGSAEYALSPGGTTVAWVKSLEPPLSGSELWLTQVSGGAGIRAVPASSDVDERFTFPVWSPDGRQIAFATSRTVINGENSGSYRNTIGVFDVASSQVRLVTSRPGTDAIAISWSPDSRSIAYLGLPDGSPLPSLDAGGGPPVSFYPPIDIFVIGADGSGDRNLTNDAASEEGLRWSPGGGHLAYKTYDDATGQRLATLPMSGRDAAGAPMVMPFDGDFAWSPDGSALLLVDSVHTGSSRGGTTTSWIRSIDPAFQGPATTLLEIDRAITCVPSWQRLDP